MYLQICGHRPMMQSQQTWARMGPAGSTWSRRNKTANRGGQNVSFDLHGQHPDLVEARLRDAAVLLTTSHGAIGDSSPPPHFLAYTCGEFRFCCCVPPPFVYFARRTSFHARSATARLPVFLLHLQPTVNLIGDIILAEQNAHRQQGIEDNQS